MQQKFKIGDKVKVLTSVYPGVYGTEGVITKIGPEDVYMVERNATNYPSDQYGHFEHDAWRYCFYESELELVEEKPKFKVGDKVRCAKGVKCKLPGVDEFTVRGVNGPMILLIVDGKIAYEEARLFDLVTDYVVGQEVYVAAGITRNLKHAVLLDAIPRNGLMHVNVGGFDCYVEEERVYTREETKGN